MMKLGDKGLNLLKKWEQGPKGGFSPVVYPCSAGKNTIGYGHVITDSDKITPPITEKQADYLLKQDIKTAENAVNLLVKTFLNRSADVLEYDNSLLIIQLVSFSIFAKIAVIKLIFVIN